MSNTDIPLEAGRVYHIYNRGINGTPIFKNKENYDHFLKLYAKYCPCVVDTYAYCLLGNHFHFLVRVKDPLPNYAALYPHLKPEQLTAKAMETVDPSTQFGHLFNAYAQGFNHSFKPKRTGGLFEEPFKRKWVDNEVYFSNLVHYIHRNPEKHGLIADFSQYPYSSYHSHLSQKATLLARQAVLDWFGNRSDYLNFHSKSVDEKVIEQWIIEMD